MENKKNNPNNQKKETSNFEKELRDMEIEFKKYKTESEMEILKVRTELDDWKKKYEEFARVMKKRFDEKKLELEKKTNNEISFEKERNSKEFERLKSSSLSDLFSKICENVLNISNSVLRISEGSSPELINYAKGFQMIINNLTKFMQEEGLQIINPKVNDKFDPKKHDAISTVIQKNVPDSGIIIEVVSPQYCLKGSTISYAKVKVAIKG